jgi:hypothetical protein
MDIQKLMSLSGLQVNHQTIMLCKSHKCMVKFAWVVSQKFSHFQTTELLLSEINSMECIYTEGGSLSPVGQISCSRGVFPFGS